MLIKVTAVGEETRLSGLIEAVHSFKDPKSTNSKPNREIYRYLGSNRIIWCRGNMVLYVPNQQLENHSAALGSRLSVCSTISSSHATRRRFKPCIKDGCYCPWR